MPQPAASIISRAVQIAKCPNYNVQALNFLNAILSDLCQTHDFALARGEFNFTFNQNLITSGGGNIVTSGPNPLPMDYLRTSGSSGSSGTQKSTIWYLQGVPYPMVPCDLAEFDIQVQQAGLQSYPWLWATDMSLGNIALATVGNLTQGSATINNLLATNGLLVGMGVSGYGIVPGTTVTGLTGITATMSNPAMATTSGQMSPLVFGTPNVGFAYPPPSGAYNVMLRYQRQMPDLTQAQVNAGAYCWFDNDAYLVEELAGRLMQITDDSRVDEFLGDSTRPGRATRRLAEYLRLKDDDSNRAQTVQLDRRTFGPSFDRLPNTKTIGWILAGLTLLPALHGLI